MELKKQFATAADAWMALKIQGIGPGTLVVWDKGTSGHDALHSRDWPGLVIKIEVNVVETNTTRWYEARTTIITPERRIRRHNARFVRRPR